MLGGDFDHVRYQSYSDTKTPLGPFWVNIGEPSGNLVKT